MLESLFGSRTRTSKRYNYYVTTQSSTTRTPSSPTFMKSGSEVARAYVDEQCSPAGKEEALPKLTIEDFERLKVIGQGGFGKVVLARRKGRDSKADAPLYAIKVLEKSELIRRNQVIHTKTEATILKQVRHPFINFMHFAFQNEAKLYMVLDYLGGGDLFTRLKREGRLPMERVRLYIAELGLGLRHLHSLHIVYRDLKPENILLDAQGHACLADFGFSKQLDGPGATTRTFCGTPEYMAPETLLGQGHGVAVDWWALGNLLFEMLTARPPPFYSQDVQEMYRRILHEPAALPSSLGSKANSLIAELLAKRPERRLGSEGDEAPTAPLDDHPFFAALDFGAVQRKEVEPQYKPPRCSAADATNFDAAFTELTLVEEPTGRSPTPPLTGDHAETFRGFSYGCQSYKE